MQTFMPRLAKRIAAARPIPDAPPVTTATLFGDMAGWGMEFSPSKGAARKSDGWHSGGECGFCQQAEPFTYPNQQNNSSGQK
jgi:hypothetical protein